MSSLLGGLIQRRLQDDHQIIDISADTTFSGEVTIQSDSSSRDSTALLIQSGTSILTDTSGYLRLITKTAGVLEVEGIYSLGALDELDASLYTDAVGAYGTRRIYAEYTGAQITIRRSSDNVEADIYFDRIGNPTKLIVVSTQEEILDPSIETWLGGATAFVKTWYDQSAGTKHLVQTTTTLQPVLKYEPNMFGYVVHFINTAMGASNLFTTTSIDEFQFIFKSKEVASITGHNFLSFNGSQTDSTRLPLFIPWGGDRKWYFGEGNNRAISAPDITVVGEVARSFGKMSPTLQKVSFTVNGNTYFSTGLVSVPVDKGLHLGVKGTGSVAACNDIVQYLLVFSKEKTETLVSNAFSKMDIPPKVIATGGTITEVNGYRIHTFTSSGTFTVDIGGEVEYLIVAGGGGGGGSAGVGASGAGGGAGGMLIGETFLSPVTYNIVIGAGGNGVGFNTDTQGGNGGNSSAFGITTIGGGGGGSRNTGNSNGKDGGSGGGMGSHGVTSTPGDGIVGQGNRGGYVANFTSTSNQNSSGGGGGAGGVGADGFDNTKSGDGGIGIESSISGSVVYYAGGGGGGRCGTLDGTQGLGGLGGGGAGGNPLGQSGSPNTGGGGGGTGSNSSSGNGGSGIVIIRYLL